MKMRCTSGCDRAVIYSKKTSDALRRPLRHRERSFITALKGDHDRQSEEVFIPLLGVSGDDGCQV